MRPTAAPAPPAAWMSVDHRSLRSTGERYPTSVRCPTQRLTVLGFASDPRKTTPAHRFVDRLLRSARMAEGAPAADESRSAARLHREPPAAKHRGPLRARPAAGLPPGCNSLRDAARLRRLLRR